MLFYAKRHPLLELSVGLLLTALGAWGMRRFGLESVLQWTPRAMALGVAGALALTAWTLLVQGGYALVRGRAYALDLTASLARHFEEASAPQVLFAMVAAAGEEVFFRGFIQGRWGLLAGSLAFMLAHIGKRDIRIIGYWSIFQGLGLGLLYEESGNLVVPILAHALFDMGAMVYFRLLMRARVMRCER